MSISDIFSAVMDFFTFGNPFGKANTDENQRRAKESVAASKEGKQADELKASLEEVKRLRQASKSAASNTNKETSCG